MPPAGSPVITAGYVIFRRNDAGQLVEQFISDSLDLQSAKKSYGAGIWAAWAFSSNLALTSKLSITRRRLCGLTAVTLSGHRDPVPGREKSKWNLSTGEWISQYQESPTSAQGTSHS